MKRLLVVDDHPMIRLGIETILRPRPEWEVCGTAGSGAEAIQKASELHPEIIIMDISMQIGRASGRERVEVLVVELCGVNSRGQGTVVAPEAAAEEQGAAW